MKLKDIFANNPFVFIFLAFIAVTSILTFDYSKTVALTELVVTLLLMAAAILWFSRTFDRKKDYVRLINRTISDPAEGTDRLLAFPFPAVIVDREGEIEWFNDRFEKMLSSAEKNSAVNISSLFGNITAEELQNGCKEFDVAASSGKYSVYPSALGNGAFALYFAEDTELKDIKSEYELSRPCVLLINTDSLEQTEDSMSHAEYYAVVSEIERLITKWLNEKGCVFRKISDGKYIAFTENENLLSMKNEKFALLDSVRACKNGDAELDITLSVGIGKEKNFTECERSARQALDMARGRGGDQVVLKNGEDYSFFGGVGDLKIKRGKNVSRYMAGKLGDCVKNCTSVIVSGHTFSDFDCIGAAVGVAAFAGFYGKDVYIVVNRETSLALPLIEMMTSSDIHTEFISPENLSDIAVSGALLVITDTMRPGLVEARPLLDRGLCTFVIDHHRQSVDRIEHADYFFHEPYASSACEMVTELIRYSPDKIPLSSVEAQALMAGIWLDTKQMSLRSGVRTFEAAVFLKDCQADTVAVRKLFSASADENVKVAKVVSEAEFFPQFAVSATEENYKDIRLICSKAADALLDIKSVDASFVLWKSGDSVFVSARSLGRVNVQLITEEFGGGGHQSMAGCRIEGCTLEEAKNKLLIAVRAYFSNNVKNTEV